MNQFTFEIQTYGWRELAQLYNPDIGPHHASKRLSQWVNNNDNLKKELSENGWKKGTKLLPPRMVEILVKYLGEP